MKQAPQLLIIKSNYVVLDSVPADKLGVVIAKQGVIKSVGGLVDSPLYPFPLSISPIGRVHKPSRLFKRRFA
jgi:hypothetical protein